MSTSPVSTSIALPRSVYEKSAEAARRLGVSVDELVAQVLERELGPDAATPARKRMDPPLVRSGHPGPLDLSGFDFDELLG